MAIKRAVLTLMLQPGDRLNACGEPYAVVSFGKPSARSESTGHVVNRDSSEARFFFVPEQSQSLFGNLVLLKHGESPSLLLAFPLPLPVPMW